MNNSYYRFVFSDLPLSVSVAFPFNVRDFDPICYKTLWLTIEENFRTRRSQLMSFYQTTGNEFERSIIKIDFRDK